MEPFVWYIPGSEVFLMWTFLSNHAHVFMLLCGEPDLRMREVAQRVDITERAVQRIVHDLVKEGYLSVQKDGRRNVYEVHLDASLRHPLEVGVPVGRLVTALRHEDEDEDEDG